MAKSSGSTCVRRRDPELKLCDHAFEVLSLAATIPLKMVSSRIIISMRWYSVQQHSHVPRTVTNLGTGCESASSIRHIHISSLTCRNWSSALSDLIWNEISRHECYRLVLFDLLQNKKKWNQDMLSCNGGVNIS